MIYPQARYRGYDPLLRGVLIVQERPVYAR